jgi:hypothetical protein
MNEPNDGVGRSSLWMSLAGLILPLVLAILATVFISGSQEGRQRRELAYFLSAFLFAVLELAAFVCGILGRRSGPGKAGLVISSISLIVVVFSLLLLTGGLVISSIWISLIVVVIFLLLLLWHRGQ